MINTSTNHGPQGLTYAEKAPANIERLIEGEIKLLRSPRCYGKSYVAELVREQRERFNEVMQAKSMPVDLRKPEAATPSRLLLNLVGRLP